MTDTPADPPALMLLFEEQVAAALELPEKERALAFEKLRADHPNHARLLERCEHAVASLMPEKRSVSAISDAVRSVALAEAPERIGDYRIVDVLGEGGMGIVYLADQQQPIRRRVALKVVKSVSAHRDALARFEVERQSLAMMEHPNIAMVLDAGEADDGRPFFAMEHVPGLPITEFCDRHRLDLRARIALFQKVCRGVQHAHEKGVVHRDLKPTNILVGHRDGLPEPKIIDFGVAKALQQRLTERTLYTEHGRILGTPEYMSPEQAG
ncbi:MAG TPA: serine/threonine-protein kinase, partial [Planctomycetota bacterium]|nr:serine/threonine-protein kinase [Planctomycetota bacterium]